MTHTSNNLELLMNTHTSMNSWIYTISVSVDDEEGFFALSSQLAYSLLLGSSKKNAHLGQEFAGFTESN
jgi:hypothetical protein